MNRISMVAVCSVNNTQCFVRTAVIVIFGFLDASVLADVSALPDPLFQGNETLDMTITGPLSSLVRERPKCEYPPVRLNLKKSQTKGTLFDKQNKLKLVIHCDYSEQYEQVVLREYLAYRILSAITDMSFRVRLLHVTYFNT